MDRDDWRPSSFDFPEATHGKSSNPRMVIGAPTRAHQSPEKFSRGMPTTERWMIQSASTAGYGARGRLSERDR
jgi:hypothetical protein